MTTNKFKLILAGAIAVIGVTLTFRALNRQQPKPASLPPAPMPEHVKVALDGVVLDTTPTPDTAEAISIQVAEKTVSRTRQAIREGRLQLSSMQVDDLGPAIDERMLVLLAPDWERGLSNLRKRGVDPPAGDAIREGWERGVEWRGGLPRLGLGQLQVRLAYDRGQVVEHEALAEGWSTLTGSWGKGIAPVSRDAEEGRLTVIEVLFPIEHKSIRGGSVHAWPTGIQLAWSEERQQWIPWRSIIYKADGDAVFTIVPFM